MVFNTEGEQHQEGSDDPKLSSPRALQDSVARSTVMKKWCQGVRNC